MTNKEIYDILRVTSDFDKFERYKEHRFLNFETDIYSLENSIEYIKQIYRSMNMKVDNRVIGYLLSLELDWDNPLLMKTLYNVLEFSRDKAKADYRLLHRDLLRVSIEGRMNDTDNFMYTISNVSKKIIRTGVYKREFNNAMSDKSVINLAYLANKDDCLILSQDANNDYKLVSCRKGRLNEDRNIVGNDFAYSFDYEKINEIMNIQSLDLLFF